MASIVRKIMRGIVRAGNRHQMAAGPVMGAQRAGMHQAAEHAYRRQQMAEALPPEEETVEEGLEMPAELEAEIPPAEEEDDQIVEEIAEGEAEISADEEIEDDISEPQAEIEEETEESSVLSTQYPEGSGDAARRADLAVDYSAERIPVLDYQVTGSVDPDTPLEYTSQDGSLKELREPLPGMAEKYGVEPYIPNAPEIIHAGTPEVDFHLDGEGNLVVSAD